MVTFWSENWISYSFKFAYFLAPLWSIVTVGVFMFIHYAFVKSILRYGIVVWGSCSKILRWACCSEEDFLSGLDTACNHSGIIVPVRVLVVICYDFVESILLSDIVVWGSCSDISTLLVVLKKIFRVIGGAGHP